MFKIAILFFAALIRCAEVEVKGKFDIALDSTAPTGYTACTEYGWGDAVAPTVDEAEPGEGSHETPYYATLAAGSGGTTQHSRCDEMLALFATDLDLTDPTYIVVAAFEKDDSVDLEIGAQACGDIVKCTAADFGVAYKLPKLQVLDTSNFKTDVMCQNFIPGDSGDGSSEDSPIYVYVDAIAVLEDHVDCGRVYGFDEYFVAVAGTTAAGSSLDGATLGIKDTDLDALSCADLTACDMDGYAIWTGKMASATTTTTTSEATTTTSDDGSTTTSDDGSTTTSDDGSTTTSDDGSTTTSDDGSTTTSDDGSTTTSVDGSTTTSDDGSTTESTTSTSPPLDTTTEEDSTFFAAVGFSLFALLA